MGNNFRTTAAFRRSEELYLNENLADVHFVFRLESETRKIPAHKHILCLLSPAFRRLFNESSTRVREVRISDATIEAFQEFLQFFYLGEVLLTKENIGTVVYLAAKYNILEHVNACATFIEDQLKPENLCWGLKLAMELRKENLINYCKDHIVISWREVFASDEFKCCDRNILKHILELNFFCAETEVFDACLEWAKCACTRNGLDENQVVNWRTQLGDCFMQIRFCAMTGEELCQRQMLHSGIFNLSEFEDIMLTVMNADYEPRIFNRNYRPTRNGGNIMICQRHISNVPSPVYRSIRHLEVISFSSDRRILLKEIHTAKIYAEIFDLFGITSSEVGVTVTERRNLFFNSNQTPLYEGTCNSWTIERHSQLKVILPTPIPIEPQRLYEIHLKISPIVNFCYYFTECKITVNLLGNLISFRKNSNLDYDNQGEGWISDLIFIGI